MKNALLKDTLREIKRTFNRFVSIFLIVALGVGFFTGIKATGPDMKLTGHQYYQDYQLMDIRLVSTLGFSEKDLEAIRQVDGISAVMPAYSADALLDAGGKSVVVRAHSLPLDLSADDPNFLNQPRLIEGRMPQRSGECVVEKSIYTPDSFEIGNTVTLHLTDEDISDYLKTDTYEIVGIVESPMYLTYDRGSSLIGSGSVTCYMMIPQEDFALDVYTDVYLQSQLAQEQFAYSEEYDQAVADLMDQLELVAQRREPERYQEILEEAQQELDDAKAELADGEATQQRELADAQKKIDDARQELADAQQKLLDGEQELADGQKEFDEKIADAQRELDEAKKELEDGESEYVAGKLAYLEAKREANGTISDSQSGLEQAQKKLEELQAQYDAAAPALEEAKEQLLASVDDPTLQALISDPTSFDEETTEAILSSLPASLASQLHSYLNNAKRLIQLEEAIATLSAQIEGGNQQIQDGIYDLQLASRELNAARRELDRGWKAYNEAYEEFLTEKADGEQELADARQELEDGRREIADGIQKLADAQQEFDDAKRDSDQEIADAHQEIADAEADLAELEPPTWYLYDRDDLPGFSEYEANADRIDAIAKVFPAFFLLVAALVSLTTMTRMVEEQRTQIGTIKALGYGKSAIVSKFLIYSTAASLLGSILGLAVGMRLFPVVIFDAYSIMCKLPSVITPFRWDYAILSTVAAILCTGLAALGACYKELAENPAALMRPKAPKAGKRVFLERLPFIWNRIGFIQKVTIRNLLRYKRRIFMTVIGIAGCTALLLTGFGMYDSVSAIADKQFGELFHYDFLAILEEDLDNASIDTLDNYLIGMSQVDQQVLMRQKTIDAFTDDKTVNAYLMVPQSPEEFQQLVTLRTRTHHEALTIPQEGAIVSEKLAILLNKEVGDTISLRDSDGRVYEAVIGAITENYAMHYIYFSPQGYEQVFGVSPEYNCFMGSFTDEALNQAGEAALTEEILSQDGVLYVSGIDQTSSRFYDMIQALQYVIIVLIASAGALAFVVLYNLTNINVGERIREIATIKVLGFYDREVSAYIYRENGILAVLGMFAGLVLGIFLHRFVMQTAEIDMIMFGRQIYTPSYWISGALTLLFAVLVNIFIHFRLKKISMVESLKSIE